ncbi:MAG: hypothetical protein COT85_06040 [Chlamydiae bacterium CG10_big_fil_rev_8_21_14_0_10_42_34]|nr:MAG: hypothetical protein COT85_06040 [Chlamydiae bacterium CG10_big_fil_rev_8_21_14_0_10_42_34]
MNEKIVKLPEAVINQIAAGEVVENPASIVKELIENSLDAGSSRISIEIVSGGQQLIRIEDDGCGMSAGDALLCLERHATSKIRSIDDLQTLSTMGFRGEALAAISSVSHFEIKTSNGIGTRILAEGGKVITVEPCARNRGTTIEVRSLFYNVPARKKFQKSPSSNAAQVSRVVETIALAHPEVIFSLNGRSFSSTDTKGRVEEILGPHEHEVSAKGITGFVAAPNKAMATRMAQYVFINRRPIFSPLISKAVKLGFGTRISEHMYPRFVLFLEISPDSVDVNVHPQKKEARFKDEGKIFNLVQRAVESAFAPMPTFSEPVSFSEPTSYSFEETFPTLPFKALDVELDLGFQDRLLTVVGSYLLLEKDGLIFVDLRAAHARVLFESLKHKKGASQALIWPLEIALARGEEEKAEKLNELGIECRVLKRTLVVDALPSFLDATHFPDFFASWKVEKKIEKIATRFCRSVKKRFSMEEASVLWRQLQKCQDQTYDPLGNPIWVKVKEEEIWSLFASKN